MAFPNTVKVNFGGGELSPQMHGRADLQIYGSGLRTLENHFITQTAGTRKRDGFELVIEDIEIDALNVEDARLVPMVRPGGEFSLLIFGWAALGTNALSVACFSEVDVSSLEVLGDDPLGPLHFLSSEAAPPPPVPTDVRCSAGNGFIRVTWSPSAGAIDYDYRYKLSTNATWTEVVTADDLGTMTTVTISGLTNDSEYDVQVRSRNADDESAWSDTITCAPSQVAPVTPDGLDVEAPDECGLRVTWDAVDGATQYQVRMRPSDDEVGPVMPWSEEHEFRWQTARVRRINTVIGGVRYEVQVRARNAEPSAWSPSEFATPVCGQAPQVPEDVEIELVDHNTVKLSWMAVPDAEGYVYRWRSEDGEWKEEQTTETEVEIDPESGEVNYFQVRATHGDLASDWSPAVTVELVPARVMNLRVSKINEGRRLTWDEVPNAESYIIQRRWRSIFTFGQFQDASSRSTENTTYSDYQDDHLEWRYRVAARNDHGTGPNSNADSA